MWHWQKQSMADKQSDPQIALCFTATRDTTKMSMVSTAHLNILNPDHEE